MTQSFEPPPPLNLNDLDSVAEHRELLVADLPDILAVAGADEQIGQLARGQHEPVVDWFRNYVSVGGHGANAGNFGLTPAQTLDFNPFAQRNGLVAPAKLWAPGDNLPEGARAGDFVEYSVAPNYDLLPPEVYQATDNIVVDALFDGTIGRIDAALGVAVRSDAVRDFGHGRVTVLTGMRAVTAAEGRTGLYRRFLPEGTPEDTPIEQAFPSAADAAVAILRNRCPGLKLIYEIADETPYDQRGEGRVAQPDLGWRTWKARYYDGVHAETGKSVLVTVVNGEAIAPTGKEMNRGQVPAPKASETLRDYLDLPFSLTGHDANLAISYAHLGRIGAGLRRAVPEGALRRVGLVGNMPQRATWDKIVDGKHNGGTLGYKEVYPYLKALSQLLDIDAGDLGSHSR